MAEVHPIEEHIISLLMQALDQIRLTLHYLSVQISGPSAKLPCPRGGRMARVWGVTLLAGLGYWDSIVYGT